LYLIEKTKHKWLEWNKKDGKQKIMSCYKENKGQ